ncbi:hypothetical protein BGZ98_002259 [Dissophora globulifera]|nr:hypothetical protein BGZ98_002259 [Dissophora globulifera]
MLPRSRAAAQSRTRRTWLLLHMIVLTSQCLSAATAVTAEAAALTRDQIYAQGEFVKKWVAPMPSSPIQSMRSMRSNNNNSNNSNTTPATPSSGEEYVVQSWVTTSRSIEMGGNDISFVKDPFQATTTTASSGNSSSSSDLVLQIEYPKGSYAPSVGPVEGGAQFYSTPFGDKTPFSKMMISYDVGFPDGFNWVLGGKLPGVYGGLPNDGSPHQGCSGGNQSNGESCFTMRLMWRRNGIGEAGGWTRMDMIMALNEPAGHNNGTLQVYINGLLVIDMENVPYRRSGMVGFEGLMFSSFFGGNDPPFATPVDALVFFKNIQLSAGPPSRLYEGTGSGSERLILNVSAAVLTIMLGVMAAVFL